MTPRSDKGHNNALMERESGIKNLYLYINLEMERNIMLNQHEDKSINSSKFLINGSFHLDS